MSFSTADGDQGRWPGAQNFYGGQDLARDLANGASADSIKAYMASNPDKFRSAETRRMINALQPSAPSSSGGGGGKSNAAASASMPKRESLFDMGGLEMPDWMGGGGGGGGGVGGGSFRPEEWDPAGITGNYFENSFNTDIDQTAQVDNSFSNSFGDNNTFGAGSMVGNQNAQTLISQNARGAVADISATSGGYVAPASYGEAKERGQKRINFANSAFDV